MKKIPIGKFDKRITLQHNVQTQDAQTGAMVDGWADVAKLWACIEPLSVRDFIAAQATQSAVSHRLTIWYRPGVKAGMRVLYGAAVYRVLGVLPDPRSGREYLTLPCEELSP